MHGSRCSHSAADTGPKSSPPRPRPGHLKLSKVPGSSAWHGGERGGESPSPTCPAALEEPPPGLVLCVIFQRRSRGPWDAKCCSGGAIPRGGGGVPPLQRPGPCLRASTSAWKAQTCWFHPAPPPARTPQSGSASPRAGGLAGEEDHQGGPWHKSVLSHSSRLDKVYQRGCSASSHRCPQLLCDMGVLGLGSLDVQQLWWQQRSRSALHQQISAALGVYLLSPTIPWLSKW